MAATRWSEIASSITIGRWVATTSPVHDHIATLYMDAHGAVIHGKVDSITREGDAVTLVASHEGSRFGGLTMST